MDSTMQIADSWSVFYNIFKFIMIPDYFQHPVAGFGYSPVILIGGEVVL